MEYWPEGTGKIVLDTTDSTNLEALRRAKSGAPLPFWVLTAAQTGGVGRRGRAWSMPAGNFAASCAFTPSGTTARWALRSYLAALALRDALAELTGQGGLFTVKWPNDVLCRDRKIAGILLEMHGDVLIVGIGVNLIASPLRADLELDAMAATDLRAETGLTITPDTLLNLLVANFTQREVQFTQQGFAPVRADWLKVAARLDQPMRARMVNREVTGTFDGIDDDGVLLIRTSTGTERLLAADIFFS